MPPRSPIDVTWICHPPGTVCRLSHPSGQVPQSCMTTRFEWDYERRHDGGAEGSVRTKESSVPSKGCIVIVEPDELIRELLERWLVEVGHQAVTVAKTHAKPMVMPPLVTTDISDSGSAGNTIAALQVAYAAPILALSARLRRGLGGSSEPAHRLHVDKVLPKPFTRQQLLCAVLETLKQT
jgi:CheY-like chemotaxis protein